MEQIERGLERLRKVGIVPIVAFMVGQVDETKEDVEMSIALLRKLVRSNPYFVSQFTITTPYPGSDLYGESFKRGLLKIDKDFFDKYNPYVELGGVTINLSKMTDEEVFNYRNEMERIYLEEKKMVANQTFFRIEKARTKIATFYHRAHSLILKYVRVRVMATPTLFCLTKMHDFIQTLIDRARAPYFN